MATQKAPVASDIATVHAALTGLTGPADYYSRIIADGPVGYWRLGELPGATTAHEEMNGMDGTYAGAALQSGDSATALLPQLDMPGAIVGDRNGAAYFFASHDATHSYDANLVVVPPSSVPNLQALTLEAWVTMPSGSTGVPTWGTPIIRTTSNMSDGYGIVAFGSTINLYVNSSNTKVGVAFPTLKSAPSANTDQNRFHHVVGTYDPPSATNPNGEMRIYLDGVLGNTRTGADVGAVKNAGPIHMGLGWGAWVGKVDEVAIYNKVLSAATIKDHYQIGIGAYPLVPPTSNNPTYSNTVWVSPQASTALNGTASDLAATLNTITGQTFSVSNAATAPSDSIQLIRYEGYTPATDAENRLLNINIPFQYSLALKSRVLNAFAAISEPNTQNGLKLIAGSDAGLQMAASYYLKVLGARFLLPNSKWSFLSHRDSIRWNVARIEQPDIPWGADFNVPGDDPGFAPDATFHADWQKWKARNLLINGIDFGNAGSDAFNQRNISTLTTTHPDWRAHDSSGNPIPASQNFGWHIVNNTAFQTFFKSDRLAQMATTFAADPSSAASLSVSTEQPQDAIEDADPSVTSPSNSVATLANAVAAGINTTYPNQGRIASFFAYGTHSAVPTIALNSNVLVTLFPGNQNTGLAPDAFFSSWIGKAYLGMNDYWAAADRDLEQPTLDMFTELPRRIRLWYPNGLAGIRNTSTTAAGASGLPWYIAAQLIWNTHIFDDFERDNMFDLAFGPDQSPADSPRAEMKTMLQRWAGGFNLTQTELTASLTNLQTALSLATDPAVKARINDFVAYVHFLVLYYEYSTGQRMRDCQILDNTTSGTPDALIQYMWRINDRDMVQAYWMMQQIITPSNSSLQAHPELASKWNTSGIGGGWDTTAALIDDTTLGNLLACDLTPPPNAQCNTTPGGSPVCNVTCPCPAGDGTCSTDADCAAGLVCGHGNGAYFGRARIDSVCWKPSCNQLSALDCPAAVGCGSSCLNVKPCSSNADCAPGEACGQFNASAFATAPGIDNVCWPTQCNTDPVAAGCGAANSPCGRCRCQPDCSAATCGSASKSDGCGGTCIGICADRVPGCTSDGDCQPGSVCIVNGGPSIGLPDGTNVCLAAKCREPYPLLVKDCGSASAVCGICPKCTPDCAGRVCGPDPQCGTDCGASQQSPPCSADSCTPAGTCADNTAAPDPIVATQGGPRSVPVLPRPRTVGIAPVDPDFSVSDAGTAVYEIPIAVPVGRAHVEPKLRLRYDSATANGALGVGWSLAGLSAISRCTQTFARDGWGGAITYTSSDRFCLDGKRLLVVGGTNYGGDQTQYRTLPDTFRRVTAHAASNFNGPASFDVETADGLILTYGDTEDSRIYGPGANSDSPVVGVWGLTKVRNAAGSYMSIHYLSTNQQSQTQRGTLEMEPDLISYGGFDDGSTAVDPDRFVTFGYEPGSDGAFGQTIRPDVEITKAAQGANVERLQRLTSITTWQSVNKQRTYKLSYDASQTGRSKVHTISECAYDPGVTDPICKPPTTFSYSLPGALLPAETVPNVVVASQTEISQPFKILDADADGMDDFIAQGPVIQKPNYDLSQPSQQPSSVSSYSSTVLVTNGSLFNVTPFSTDVVAFTDFYDGIPDTQYFGQDVVYDIDNDGRDDLVRGPYVDVTGDGSADAISGEWRNESPDSWATEGPTSVAVTYTDRISTSPYYVTTRHDIFYPPTIPTSIQAPAELTSSVYQDLILFDGDGDGRPNVVSFASGLDSRNFPGRSAELEFTRDDNQHVNATWNANFPIGPIPLTLDLNIPLVSAVDGGVVAAGPIKFIDVNADGALDILELTYPNPINKPGAARPIRAYINRKGGGFDVLNLGQPFPSLTLSESMFKRARVIDYNGDGRPDLLIPTGVTTDATEDWVAYLNIPGTLNGAFNFALANGHLEIPRTYSKGSPPVDSCAVADLNGDDRDDLLCRYQNNQVQVLFGDGNKPDLLTTIDNGSGKKIEIDYDQAGPSGPVYQSLFSLHPGQNCGPFSVCLKRLNSLVSEYRVIETTGQERVRHKFRFQYEDAREGSEGSGWLGFGARHIDELDDAEDLVAHSDIEYDNQTYSEGNFFPYAGLVSSITRTTATASSSANIDNNNVSRVVNTANQWAQFTANSDFPYIYLANSTTTVSDVVDGTKSDLSVTSEQRTDPDQFGNLQSDTTSWGMLTTDASSNVATETIALTPYSDQAHIDAWQIQLPQTIVHTHTRNGDGQTRTTQFTFDQYGRLATTIAEPGDAVYQLTTEIFPTDSDTVSSVVQVSIDGTRRSTVYGYGVDTMFPETVSYTAADGQHPVPPTQTSQVRFDPVTGALLTSADPNGIVRQWAYDGFGRMRRFVGPGSDVAIDYAAAGPPTQVQGLDVLPQLTVSTSTVGHGSESQDLDAFGRVVHQTRAGFHNTVASETAYDGWGLVSARTRPHAPGDDSQGVIEYQHDERGRTKRVIYPDGSKVQLAYGSAVSSAGGANGPPADGVDVVQQTNQTGKVRLRWTDVFGNPVETIDELQEPTTYAYEAFNLPASVSDYRGNTHVWLRDQLGFVRTELDPDRGAQTFDYDAFGQVRKHVDGNNRPRTFEPDAFGRILSVREFDGSRSTWQYDGPGANTIGRLVSSTSSSGHTTTYEYEPPTATGNRGFLQRVTHTPGQQQETPTGTFEESYDYDDAGRLQFLHYPPAGYSGKPFAVKYDYDDSSGMVIKVENADPNTNMVYWELTSADQGFRVGTETRNNGGVTTTYGYEPGTGRVSGITTYQGSSRSTVLRDLSYTYFVDGNMQTRTGSALVNGAHVSDGASVFTYDDAGRLHKDLFTDPASGNTSTNIYYYDDMGNVSDTPTLSSYSYDGPQPHAVTSAGRYQFTYDGNGNMASRSATDGSSQVFSYTGFNLPSSILDSSAGTVTYEYDAEERLALRSTGHGTTEYVGERYERRTFADDSSAIEHVYRVFVNGNDVAEVQRVEQNGSITSDKVLFIVPDVLGSTSAIVDESNHVLVAQSYSPFGNSSQSVYGTTGIATGFTGHQDEADVDLVYMKGRFYEPGIARFTTPDPTVGVEAWSQDLNAYTYARNNPLKWVDPTGFDPENPNPNPQPPGGPSQGPTDPCQGERCGGGTDGSGTATTGGGDSHSHSSGGAKLEKAQEDHWRNGSVADQAFHEFAAILAAGSQAPMSTMRPERALSSSDSKWGTSDVNGGLVSEGVAASDETSSSSLGRRLVEAMIEGIVCAGLGCDAANAPELQDTAIPVTPELSKILASATLAMEPGALGMRGAVGVERGVAGVLAGAELSAKALATEANAAVFWVGIGADGAKAAEAWAAGNGGKTLAMIMAERGISLPVWDPTNPAVVAAWRAASASFAAGARGTVRVLQSGFVETGTIWSKVEFPALIDNLAVTRIISVNPATGAEVLLWAR